MMKKLLLLLVMQERLGEKGLEGNELLAKDN